MIFNNNHLGFFSFSILPKFFNPYWKVVRYGNTNDCNSYGYSYEFPDQAGVPKLEIEYYDTEHEGSKETMQTKEI